MAEIPLYRQQKQLPTRGGGFRLNPGMGAAPGAQTNPALFEQGTNAALRSGDSLVQSMAVLSHMGDQLANSGQRLMQVSQTAQRNTNLSALNKGIIELQDEYKGRQDYTNFEKDYRDKVAQLRTKYEKGLIGPWADSYGAIADGQAVRGLVQVRGLAREKAGQHWRASFTEQQTGLLTQASMAGTPKAQEVAFKQHDALVDEGVSLGFVQPDKAAVAKGQFRGEAQYILGQEAARLEPEALLKHIDDPDYLKNLTPQHRLAIKKIATAKAEEFRVTAGYDKALAYGKGDLDRAISYALTPEGRQALGLKTIDEQAKVATMLRAARVEQDAREKEVKEQVLQGGLKRVGTLLLNGNRVEALKQFNAVAPQLSASTWYTWAERLASPDKTKAETTDIAWAKLDTAVYDHQVFDWSTESLLAAGIAPKDLETARDRIKAARDSHTKDGGYNFRTQAIDAIKVAYPGQDNGPLRVQMLRALNLAAQAAKVGPGDPKYFQLAKNLMDNSEDINVVGQWSNVDTPGEAIAYEVERTGQMPSVFQDEEGRIFLDPQLPEFTTSELYKAQDLMKDQGIRYDQLSVDERRRWILGAKEGVQPDQIRPEAAIPAGEAGLEQRYGTQAVERARAAIKAKGYLATPANIEAVIKKYLIQPKGMQ